MTRKEVFLKAFEKRITWLQAADILGLSPRHIRRMRRGYERFGVDILHDQRGSTPRRKKVAPTVLEELRKLRRELYADFSVKHFHERITEKHGISLSYNWTRLVLQEAGLGERTAGRGKFRRKRERRPMVGMMLHIDGSTHEWIPGLPMQDLIVVLDDADGRILYAQFVEQEGTMSTFQALHHVLRVYGRFCELYTDRGSHFCRTEEAGAAPADVQDGQVSRALRVLGIRQILARSPEARGRSERAFGTIQGRLPQELRLAGIKTYPAANRYLVEVFLPDFNQRFTVRPAQPEKAFTKLTGIDLSLLLSVHHERNVRNDNTIAFEKLLLQLPSTRQRSHFVRCQVLVHELVDGALAVSFQGRKIATFNRQGDLLPAKTAPLRQAA